jgi:hypothetical protein
VQGARQPRNDPQAQHAAQDGADDASDFLVEETHHKNTHSHTPKRMEEPGFTLVIRNTESRKSDGQTSFSLVLRGGPPAPDLFPTR